MILKTWQKNLRKFYLRDNMFNDDEKKILKHFFTNVDGNTFALINLPEVVKGTLFARYSRSDKDLRKLFLDDFFSSNNNDFKNIVGDIKNVDEQLLAIKKAEEFYNRVLLQYGDDSVAELGGAHIALENASNLATKFFEDARIGISPLEKSSRYIYFDTKENGQYKYYRDEEIMNSEFANKYVETMDFLFDTYCELMGIMRDYYSKIIPNSENLSERAFEAVLRAKTCDTIRGLLPASTLTNFGMYGNGRAFEYLINKSFTSSLDEIKNLGEEMYTELEKVFPSFIKRSKSEFGISMQDFLKSSKLPNNFNLIGKDNERVILIDYDLEAEDKILSKILFKSSNLSMQECYDKIKLLTEEEKEKLISDYVGERKNRRHKPLRAFENVDYTFEILGNFGAYRDLQRHRILTQERQLLTTYFGYEVPKDLVLARVDDKYKKALDKANELYLDLVKLNPEKAQYCVPFAYNLRWYFKLNLRALYHLLELRTIRQGHPDYRLICQEMFKQVLRVHPNLIKYMKFVDMKNYDFERLESEKEIDKRLNTLDKL